MNFKIHLRRVLAVGSVETLGVVLGGIASLLIVNVLPKEQYAQYTFLISCMMLMISITDTGLAHCCLPIVGQRSGEGEWVTAACNQVFRKRWWLLLAGFFIVVPYWFITTRQHPWAGTGYWLASALVVAVPVLSLPGMYANTVLMILGKISALTRIVFLSLVARMLLVLGVLLLPVTAYTLGGIMAATLASTVLGWVLYRRSFAAYGLAPRRLEGEAAKSVDKEIYRIAKPLVLPSIFYHFEGLITVFVASLFGTADMLAEVGALGRISMILMVFDRIGVVLLFPAIARAPEGKGLLSMIVKGHLAYVGVLSLLFLTSIFLPEYWILLIGSKYEEQQSVLWMVFLSTLLMNCAQFAFVTLTSRGHTRRQSFVVPFVLILQILCLYVFGVSSLHAVLALGIATSLGHFLYQYAMLTSWFFDRVKHSRG